VGKRGLGHKEVAEDIRPECAFELLFRDVLDALLRMLLSSIVDEDVKVTELFDSLLHGGLAELLAAHVSCDREAFPALGFDQPAGLFRVGLFIEIDDCDVCAHFRKEYGDCSADSAVAACNHRGLTLELACGLVVSPLGLWSGLHLFFEARPTVLVLRGLKGLFLLLGFRCHKLNSISSSACCGRREGLPMAFGLSICAWLQRESTKTQSRPKSRRRVTMGVPERKPPAGLHDVASLKKLTQRVFCRNFHLYLNWLVYEHGLGR